MVSDTLPKQGLRMARLNALVDRIKSGEYGAIDGLLIQRHGEIVIDEYFRGTLGTEVHSLQSVTKSFASALTGIAIEKGYIDGVDQLVMDFFPQWQAELSADPFRAAMRIEDILTMRTGSDYNEDGPNSPHFELNALPTGWDYYWLSRPMIREPGTVWQYDSGGVITLSSIIKFRYGAHADVAAKEWLFEPLGIDTFQWFTNQEGHPHLGGGLSLTQRDMAKFGELYLRGGVWDGKQVVPAGWVQASFARQVPLQLFPHQVGYGYLWWIFEPDPDGSGEEDIRAAIGAGGQYIFVIPEHDMVVVVTSDVQTGSAYKPIEFLYGEILPSVLD